jgi:hypothetical protein
LALASAIASDREVDLKATDDSDSMPTDNKLSRMSRSSVTTRAKPLEMLGPLPALIRDLVIFIVLGILAHADAHTFRIHIVISFFKNANNIFSALWGYFRAFPPIISRIGTATTSRLPSYPENTNAPGSLPAYSSLSRGSHPNPSGQQECAYP